MHGVNVRPPIRGAASVYMSIAMLADAVDPRASVLIHVVLARHVT